MVTLFRAGGQLIKVRAFMILSLVCAAGCIWWGIDLAQTYGSRPADGGMLAPLGIRLAWGIGVASLGIAFAAGMWLYGRCYVARMDLDEKTGKLYVHTVRFFGNKKQAFDVSDVSVGEYHEGILELADTPSVNAPWTTVKVSGRRLPLIVDEQGEFFRSEAAERLFGSAREARSVHDEHYVVPSR